MNKYNVGIIGALEEEVRELISMLSSHESEEVGGIVFHTGTLSSK